MLHDNTTDPFAWKNPYDIEPIPIKAMFAAYCIRAGIVTLICAALLIPIQWSQGIGGTLLTTHSATIAIAIVWTARWAQNFKTFLHNPNN